MIKLRNGFLINLLFVASAFSQPLTLGPYSEYNAIIFEDYSASSSDVEGRLAVGGNININHYSVGDKLDPNTLSDVLISGGDITFPSGRVYYGNILASGSVAGIGSSVLNGMESGAIVQGGATLPFDFQAAYSYFDNFSQQLALLNVNTTYEYQWGGLYLHGDCSSPVQVFNLNGNDVLSAHTFQVDCIPQDAYVIFNINGQQAGLTNMSMSSLESYRTRVMYNFYEATNLTLSGIGVEGTILAPHADINNPQGVIKGQLIAKSWNGMMQINHVPFEGEVSHGNQAPEAHDQTFKLQKDEVLQWQLDAADVDGDALTYDVISEVQFGSMSGTAPDLVYTPLNGFTGIDTFEYQVNDGNLDSGVARVTFEVGQSVCRLYPYTVESQVVSGLNTNDVVNNYSTSVGQGNYSLLTWDGANDTNILATSFTVPGNSENYINPDDSNDHRLNINDWVQGAPGKNNAKHVRNALDQLVGETITIPVWSETRGSGSHFDYLVNGFINIELTDYKLNGQSNISFIYQGETTCYNFAPFTKDATTETNQNQTIQFKLSNQSGEINGIQNLPAVFDADADQLNFQIEVYPINGTLTGSGPNFSYQPNAGFYGQDSFDFYVNDGTSDSNVSTITIDVLQTNEPPIALNQTINLPEDTSTSFELQGQDPDGNTLSYEILSSTTNGSLTGQAPQLTYTPDTDFNGTDQLIFKVSDGQLYSNIATVDFVIEAVNDAPMAIDIAVVTDEDTAVSLMLSGSDPDGDALSYLVLSQPSNGVVSGTAPDLVYTPNADFNGIDSFTYLINDGQLDSDVATVNITVSPINDAPKANNLSFTTDEDTTLTITLSGNDPESDVLTYSVLSQPANGILTGNAPNLIYTPNTNFNGSDSLTYLVNDGVLDSNIATVNLVIDSVNDVPVANHVNVSVDEDGSVLINLLGSDVDGDVLNYILVTQPNNGTLYGAGGSYTYTPNPNYSGNDGFTFRVNDGVTDSNTASVFITVNAGNDAPVANDLSVAGDEDTAISITLTGSDPEGDSLTYQIISQPSNGILSGSIPNLTYTPNIDFNGEDSFTYLANDGLLDSSAATVNITVNPVNDIPVADPQWVSVEEDTTLSIILTGSDADGDSLTYVISAQPSNGTLTGAGDTYSYTPNNNFSGTDGFEFYVNDGTTDSVPVTISITVNSDNDAPVADSAVYTTDEDTVLNLSLSGSDQDGDVLTFEIVGLPNSGVLTGSAPDLVYIPNENFNGSDSFTFVVNDGKVNSAEAVISLAINPVNDLPVVENQTLTIEEDSSLIIDVTGFDIEGDILLYQMSTAPISGVISGDLPVITYQPNENFNGEDSLVVEVSDGEGGVTTATIMITVTAVNDAPIADAVIVTTAYNTAAELPLSGSDIEDNTVIFQIEDFPTDGQINENTGIFTYTPNNGFIGEDTATYVVLDSEGLASDAQTISITVEANNNLPPEITSTAPATGSVSIDIQYDVEAIDPDGDLLNYQLLNAPNYATIDVNSGLITWIPDASYSLGLDSDNLQCKFSSEQPGDFRQVQLVTLIDGSGSMHDERIFLSTWLPQLNGEMLAVGLGQNDQTDFSVGRFERAGVLQELSPGRYFGSIDEISNVLVPISDLTGPGGGNENGVTSMIDILEDYSYNADAQQIFIMMTDEGCASCPNVPENTVQLNQMLADRNDVLHTVIPTGNMTCPDGRSVMGIDYLMQGYVAEDNGNFSVCKEAIFENFSEPNFEHYIEPAFLTGGSVWNVNLLSGLDDNSRSASESIAKVIAKLTQNQASFSNAADLFVDDINHSGDQLLITIKNRGIADSLSTTFEVTDSNGQINTYVIPALPPFATETVVVEKNSVASGEITLNIFLTEDCNIDNNQSKLAYFDVEVDDNNSGTVNQSFFLKVNENNMAPSINPIDDQQILAGITFELPINASDPNKGDALSYAIIVGSNEATINPNGLLQWQPVTADVGITHPFTIRATDLAGESVETSFDITVLEGIQPLFISSTPTSNAVYGETYQYQVEVSHDPASEITISLLNGPDGMILNPQGLVTWDVPLNSAEELATVVLVAEDQFGNSDSQAFLVVLDEPPTPPVITSALNEPTQVGDDFTYWAEFADINAFETFEFEFLHGPQGIYINNYNPPFPDFQYENIRSINRWDNATTAFPENKSNINHWCGSGDLNWLNLTPQISETVIIGPVDRDGTFSTNLLATSLTDTNQDGLTNQQDVQFIIYSRDFGVAAMNARTLVDEWFQPDVRPSFGGFNNQLAAADIDQDGNTEVLVMSIDGYLRALSHQGDLLWVSESAAHSSSAGGTLVIVEDLDANGDIEIIAGTHVYDHLGNEIFDFGQFNFTAPTFAATGDIDHDGTLEIIHHNTVYNHDGSILYDGLGDGNYYAIANFDSDPELEWVQVHRNNKTVKLFDHDASVIWQQTILSPNMPNIADVDFDGQLDIVMTHAVIKSDGTIVRDQVGDQRYDSVLTDLNLDGAYELISSWERINAIDPITGDKIFEWNRSRGFYDFVLVDRFSDGNYQIAFPHWVNRGTNYIDFIKSADGNWQGGPGETKQTYFNQALSVSGEPNKNSGVLLEQVVSNNLKKDFHVTGPQFEEVTGGIRMFTELKNLTPTSFSGELSVNFYANEISPTNLLGTTIVNGLTTNLSQKVYWDNVIDPYNQPGDSFIAEVVPTMPQSECRTDNNQASSEYVFWQVTDKTGLSDQQAYSIRMLYPDTVPSVISSISTAYALQNYQEQLQISHYNENDALFYVVYTKPAGMTISSTGLIEWTPSINQVGTHPIFMYVQDDAGNRRAASLNITVDPPLNYPPYFTSTPPQSLYPNEPIEYPVTAIDPEGGEIQFSLTVAPMGMVIDSDGLLTWTPTSADNGEHDVVIEITDDAGLTAQQSFLINVVTTGNEAPVITSSPNLDALVVNDTFQYQLEATDADGDTISFNVIEAPANAQMDTAGLLTYVADSLGTQTFTLEARDALGAWTRQSFTLYVNDTPNNAPNIENEPPMVHPYDGTDYSHQVMATDVDNDPLSYRLIQAPSGMAMNPLGEITWPASTLSVGRYFVEIEVNDGRGGFARQSFDLFIGNGNFAPIIESQPPTEATVNRLYQYDMVVTDPDTAALVYELIEAPTGMVVDSSGLISWTPSQVGEFTVIAQVSDEIGFARQTWNITASEAGGHLDVQVTLDPTVVLPGELVTVAVNLINVAGTPNVTATFDGNPIILDSNLQTQVSSAELGSHTIEATVTDDMASVTTQAVFVVSEVVDTLPPEVDILSPGDGGIITGFNDISVRVQDDNLANWKLSYRYAEDDFTGRVTLAEGTGNVNDAVVANWDTSLLRNGIYVLLIEATDLSGQRSSIAHSIFLEGDLKLGHFSIAFEDLNIPVAGIPITITRGYDTRDRNRNRAFGKGWSIGYQSVRVQESRIPGLSWFMEAGFYYYGPVRLPRYCIKPAGSPLVSVVLPDGKVEKFEVKAKTINPSSDTLSHCQNITPPEYFGIEFKPQGDTTSVLSSSLGSSGLNVINGNLQELDTFEPVNPNLYTLTMLDGTEYYLDQGFNVREIKATTGHTLTFTENGIEHSGGLSVSFIRDTEGRITRIEKADGEGVDYAYDTNGDLVSFTDLNGNTTTYTYVQDHYLEDIIDPRGIRVARNEYDTDGRLIAHIDADGNRIEYENDLIAMTSTITDRRGNSTINAFDNAGNIIAQTNALGETTSYEYNHLRLETARINDLGHRTEWTYDSQGNQLTEKDPLGHITTSTYNHKAELLTQTDALGNPTIVNDYNPDYDPQRPSDPQHGYAQLNTVTDALGRTTQFHWLSGLDPNTGESISVNTGYTDADGNRYDIAPISGGTNAGLSGSSTDLNGLRTETTYDDEARPLIEKQIVTDEFGVTIAEYTTSYEYNSNGDVIKVTDTFGNITRTEYNALNKVSATIDAQGRRTEMEYDNRGNQILTRYPDDSTETQVYDEENNVIESTDRAGRTTKTIYDALNRVEAVIYPDSTPGDDTDNPMTVNTYDAAGRLVAVSDALGNTTTYEYDAAGRRTKTTDALGNETTSVYDALGRRTQSTDALGRVTTFEYNALGNLVKTNFATGTHTTTTYDNLGRKVAETDLAGLQTQYEYDAAGNLTAVIDSLNQRTEYTYDQRGNKLTQTDANGHTTSWAYDALNRVTSRTLPMGEVESYTYDAVGNRVSKTDFNGDTTSYEYNNLNQLVKTTYSDSTTVVNTYTITGQMESVTETNGTTSYQYDAQDRLVRIDYPTGNYIEYQYDLNGKRTQVKTANQTVDYTFDQLNRLKTVVDSNGTTTYTYDAVGNRASQSNANGTKASYTYDNLNRLTNLVHTNSVNATIASYSYELGANGNRLKLTEGTGRVVDYTYDNLYRLLTETVTDPVNGNHSSQWSYDPVGNRLQQTIDGVVTTYTYNNNDHLLTETENSVTTSYVYDNNGNTLSKSVDAVLDTSYSYSKDNRMLSASTGTSIISYTYDAGGIRQSQTVDGLTTNYLVDPNRSYAQVLEEQDSLFVPQVIYTYGDDLINQTRASQTTTYGYDGLGSTRILTDMAGTVQNSYGYQAFGELDYQHGTIENSYLFTGEQYDNNVGFYYLRARFYNPSIGRFQNMDTFPGMQFEPLSLHKYLYTNGDPINNIDPWGYFSIGQIVTAQNVNAISNSYAVASIAVQFATGNFAGGAFAIAEEIVYSKLGAFKPVAKQSEKLVKLLGNIWGRGVKLKLGLKANSTTLRHNMQELLGRAPANHQAHHLVAGTSANAEKARKILKKHDIDINSPSNGVFLPDCTFKGGGGVSTIHCGRHTQVYDALVTRVLTSADAGGKAAVISALTNIRLQLLSGELALNAAKRL